MMKILDAVREVTVVRQAWETAVAVFGNMGSGPRRLSPGERRVLATLQRDSIHRELADRARAARTHEELQHRAYNRLWQSVRTDADEPAPPTVLQASVSSNVTFALTVVGDFDAAREEPGPFAECLYRPAADLPYPEKEIRRCCEFLIGIVDSRPEELAGDYNLLAGERDALGFALFSLDYFLDLPPAEIPRQKMQNLAFARHQYLAGSAAPAKPRPGDLIVRKGPESADRVEHVIGISDGDEWMVLGASGVPVRVLGGPVAGEWIEVQEVSLVTASWLDLTPPAGMPALDAR